MELPYFLDLEGDALIFNQDNAEFVFIVPEVFFNSTSKNAIAEIKGDCVSTIGLFDYYIVDSKGKKSPLKPFRFPTMFLTRPYKIEKAKGLVIDDLRDNESDDEEDNISDSEEDKLAKDYRLLRYKKGDQVVCQTRVPQIIDNVELFYKLAIITAKIPTTIPYDEIWQLFLENMNLNSSPYGLNAQLFGIVIGAICRDPKDISKPFRTTSMKDMHKYKPISIKLVPNYISPYTSIISENWDESLRSAILMKDRPEEEIPDSPLEKIVMQ